MKNSILLKPMGCILFTFSVISLCCSCHKEVNKKDCGCNADNYTQVINQRGLLLHRTNTWVLANDSTQFPAFTGLICNEDARVIKNFTDTAAIDSIPVLFSGKKSTICIEAGQHRILSANYYAFNITIDSLKIN